MIPLFLIMLFAGCTLSLKPAIANEPIRFDITDERCTFSDYDAENHCETETFSCKMFFAMKGMPCTESASPLPRKVAQSFIPVGLCKNNVSDPLLLFLPAEDITKEAKDRSCAYTIGKATLKSIIEDTKEESRKFALSRVFEDAYGR